MSENDRLAAVADHNCNVHVYDIQQKQVSVDNNDDDDDLLTVCEKDCLAVIT